MGEIVSPKALAKPYMDEVRAQVADLPPIRLVGILASEVKPSHTYSRYAQDGCAAVGIEYDERTVPAEQVSGAIFAANQDPDVHGLIVYYPVFGGARDRSLQNEVAPEKDVEGLHGTWTQKLYHDVRFWDDDSQKKAILPCTPLGIVKALEGLGIYDTGRPPREQAAGLKVTVFNRSEVVGRPLAALLAHDGAEVTSFDIEDVRRYHRGQVEVVTTSRAEALEGADVVISGVPSKNFEKIRGAELKPGAVCVNFAHVKNMDDDVVDVARCYLKRVGPLTVAMLLRNTLRLYHNFHARS